MDQQLKQLIENSPSVIRNSIGIRLVKLVAGLSGSLLFLSGFALLISGLVSGTLMETIMPEEFVVKAKDTQMVWNTVSVILGLTGVIIGLMLLFMVTLSKMVLTRNAFIFNLFGWWVDYEKQQKAQAKLLNPKQTV